jgi:hypothetical protein
MGAVVSETGNGEHTDPDFDFSQELREHMMDDEVDDNILLDDVCWYGDADDDRMAFPSTNYDGTTMDIPTSDSVVEDHHHAPSFKQD